MGVRFNMERIGSGFAYLVCVNVSGLLAAFFFNIKSSYRMVCWFVCVILAALAPLLTLTWVG